MQAHDDTNSLQFDASIVDDLDNLSIKEKSQPCSGEGPGTTTASTKLSQRAGKSASRKANGDDKRRVRPRLEQPDMEEDALSLQIRPSHQMQMLDERSIGEVSVSSVRIPPKRVERPRLQDADEPSNATDFAKRQDASRQIAESKQTRQKKKHRNYFLGEAPASQQGSISALSKQQGKKKKQGKPRIFQKQIDSPSNSMMSGMSSVASKGVEVSKRQARPRLAEGAFDAASSISRQSRVSQINKVDDKALRARPRLTEKEIEDVDAQYEVKKQRVLDQDLVQQTLSLRLFAKFRDKNVVRNLPVLHEAFDKAPKYFDRWHLNFLHETFCQLINHRSEMSYRGKMPLEQFEKQERTCFEASLRASIESGKKKTRPSEYIEDELLQFELRENHLYNFTPNIQKLKRFDLLLLSTRKLTEKEYSEMKKTIDGSLRKGLVLAMVSKSLTEARQPHLNHIEIRVYDGPGVEICFDYCNLLYAYKFDSLLTNIRESQALKAMCKHEFIFNPKAVFGKGKGAARSKPFKIGPKTKYQTFLKKYEHLFNFSQFSALTQVANMDQKNQFLLVQGPPGTGKTTVIQGMIAMVSQELQQQNRITGASNEAQTFDDKIVVCTQSNVAVDVILSRYLSNSEKFGFKSQQEVMTSVVRVTSLEYEPTDQDLLKVTFDGKYAQSFPELQKRKENENKRKLDKLKTSKRDLEQQWDDIIYQAICTLEKEAKSRIEKLKKESKEQEIKSQKDLLQKRIKELKQYQGSRSNELFKKVQDHFDSDDQDNLRTIQKKLVELENEKSKLEEEEKRGCSALKDLDDKSQEQFKLDVLCKVQIIFTTLSQMGKSLIQKYFEKPGQKVKYLFVDEACQSVELSTLIPIQYLPERIVLIGDQKQLPATTSAPTVSRTHYDRSLFERLLYTEAVQRVMLNMQYRMHPAISKYPSAQFYGYKLLDDASVVERTKDASFQAGLICEIQREYGPLKFFNIIGSSQENRESSWANVMEVLHVVKILKRIEQILNEKMKKEQPSSGHPPMDQESFSEQLRGAIGVITPYAAQVKELTLQVKRFLSSHRPSMKLILDEKMIQINTVDSFQGSEKDVIIFSCVRSMDDPDATFDARKMIGFLADPRRMNVALTRAKHCLLIVGSEDTLKHEKRNWAPLIKRSKTGENAHQDIFDIKQETKMENKPNNHQKHRKN